MAACYNAAVKLLLISCLHTALVDNNGLFLRFLAGEQDWLNEVRLLCHTDMSTGGELIFKLEKTHMA